MKIVEIRLLKYRRKSYNCLNSNRRNQMRLALVSPGWRSSKYETSTLLRFQRVKLCKPVFMLSKPVFMLSKPVFMLSKPVFMLSKPLAK